MDSAHQLELTITGQTIITKGREPRIATGHFTGLADLLRDLVYVRDSLGIPLLVPGNWSGTDQVAIRRAAHLLRGHEVPLPIGTLSQVASPEVAQELVDVLLPNGALLDTELVDYTLTFSGHTLLIAPLYARISRVALDNAADITVALNRGDEEIPIKLVAWPGSTAVCRIHHPQIPVGRRLSVPRFGSRWPAGPKSLMTKSLTSSIRTMIADRGPVVSRPGVVERRSSLAFAIR